MNNKQKALATLRERLPHLMEIVRKETNEPENNHE